MRSAWASAAVQVRLAHFQNISSVQMHRFSLVASWRATGKQNSMSVCQNKVESLKITLILARFKSMTRA